MKPVLRFIGLIQLSEMRMANAWPEEDVNFLKHCWDLGLTYEKIGMLMGKTRSSISGKVHRLDLEGRTEKTKTLGREPSYKTKNQVTNHKKRFGPNQKERVKLLFEHGFSTGLIADYMGLEVKQVNSILNYAGVKRGGPPRYHRPRKSTPKRLEGAQTA